MSNTFKGISAEEALKCSKEADGFSCVTLTEDKFPGLAALRAEVEQAIKASAEIKAIQAADLTEEAKAEQLKPLENYVKNNVLFESVKDIGLQENVFKVLEEQDAPKKAQTSRQGCKLVRVIWSTQMRTVPEDLIRRPNPNRWSDGPATDAHVDSHGKRVLTEYIVDAQRLADCWRHSPEFRDVAAQWMSLYFPKDIFQLCLACHPKDLSSAEFTDACLARLTRDMRRLRYHARFSGDGSVAPLLDGDVEEDDKAPSTFWSAFDMVPLEASSFWMNLTPSADERVAKALAFCNPGETTEVEDRAATKRAKTLPSRPGAGGVKWATHTFSGPELVPKPEQEYKVVRQQPFGMVTAWDTRVAPHVAEINDQRQGAIRVSVEARRLTFAVNTNAWNLLRLVVANALNQVALEEGELGK